MIFTKEQISSIEQISLRYYDELYSTCLYKLDFDEEAAQICIQETYLALEESLKNKQLEIRDCKGWLFGVMYVMVKKHRRENATHNSIHSNLSPVYENSNIINFADKIINAEEVVEKKEKSELLLKKSRQLKEDEKKLIVEVYFNDKKLTEVAKENGLSESAMKKRHQRLKQKLLEIYRDEILESCLGRAAK